MAGKDGRTRLPDANGDDPPPDRRFFSRADDGRVISTDAGGAVVWDGFVDGCPALDVVEVGDSRHAIVLLDWMQRPAGIESWHPYPNLLMVDDHGRQVWRAELPKAEDDNGSFTSVRLVDGRLEAHLWAGDVRIDPATGALGDYVFTK